MIQFNDLIYNSFVKYDFAINENELSDISKRGGGIDGFKFRQIIFNLIKWHLEFEHISNQLILDMAYPIIPSNIRMSITMAIHFILRSESNWNTFKIRRNIMRIVPNIPIFHKASWVDNVLDENTGMLANKKVIIAIKMPIYSNVLFSFCLFHLGFEWWFLSLLKVHFGYHKIFVSILNLVI